MWTKYFNRIFVINLPENPDRLARCQTIMRVQGIKFEVFRGIKREDGAQGILETYLKIWEQARDLDRILIFEDDVKFLINPNLVMDRCVSQLKKIDWDLFYMGPNTHQPFTEFKTPNLLPLTEGYGLHATAFSRAGIKKILELGMTKPVDVSLAAKIQTLGNCYACYPLIATQENGYSDIQKKEMDQGYIEQRFYQHVKHLT